MNGGQGLPALGDVWIDSFSCYGEKVGNGDKFRSVMMDIRMETEVLVERGKYAYGAFTCIYVALHSKRE